MTDQDSLKSLRGLHQDLIALENSQLLTVERLWADLEIRIDEFRKLLDKSPKNETSRNTLLSGMNKPKNMHLTELTEFQTLGKIQIDDEEYSINEEFKETTLQLADALDLNEIDSARLLLQAQQDVEALDRPHAVSAVIRFHEQRQFLVECLRLLLKCSADTECEEDVRDVLRQLVALILETKDGPARNGSLFAQKCLQAMKDIEGWLRALGDRHQGTLTLGHPSTPEYDEIMGFQQLSLAQQHESLAAIYTYLIKANHTGPEDFYKLLDHLPALDRWNNLAIHYVPIILALCSQYGSPDGSATLREARMLNTKIIDSKDSAPWTLRNLQAATITWWLSEYSGWYLEQPTGSPVQGMDLDAEAIARSDAFLQALRDGAFQCTLSICSEITPEDWNDQMRNGLTEYLLRETLTPICGVALNSNYFRDLVMEQLETFTDAFITNMPDTLRRFRVEEDDQRKRINSGLQPGVRTGEMEHDLHLERFLVIISYAFENRVDAAQSFWADSDSNLYGFLQWASKRQSTPRVGAFCETLRSIAKGEECATSAHHFLLQDSDTPSARIRRSSSLSWAQIVAELTLYTSKIGEQAANIRPPSQYNGRPSSDDIDEPESALMLECYLRLISHICHQSKAARSWILNHPTFRIFDVLFLLCSNNVPSRIHARAFATLGTLLTDKKKDVGDMVWSALDLWASGGFPQSPSIPKSTKITSTSMLMEDVIFQGISNDVEETTEFIGFLYSLVVPASDESGLNDSLPFPEQLGSTYRMPGIEPYIDFVLGRIFAVQVHQLENSLRRKILRLNILNFTATCLASFNEDLVILANRSNVPIDTAMNASSLLSYVRLHPFSRVMEWMFNDRVLVALFATAHQNVDDISNASPESPLVLALLRSIDVMNLIMDLQSTYLDIVRPLIKTKSTGRSPSVINPSLASFEDSVATNLHLIVDLGLYCGVGIQQLTISSLKLLEKLSSSRKLNTPSMPGLGSRLNTNRLVGVLEQTNELERVIRSLILAMELDVREMSYGAAAPGWTIKSVVLDFLNHSLAISPEKPCLAHSLLGFHCNGSMLDIEPTGLFARSSSLFHTILRLIIEYPDGSGGMLQSWSLSLRQKGLQLLSSLWSSPLTSMFTLTELRTTDFLFALLLKQIAIEPNAIWEQRSIKDPEFLYSESSLALEHYLSQRYYFCEYASAELRLVATENIPSLRARIFSSLLGSTSMPDGGQITNLTVFDLLDFIDLDLSDRHVMPQATFFAGIDFDIGLGSVYETTENVYNLKSLEELMALHLSKMRKEGRLQNLGGEQQALTEAQNLLLYFHGNNSLRRLRSIRSNTLKAWANLLAVTISHCELDQISKSSLILQSSQILVPKLENYAEEGGSEATDIAHLLQVLLLEFNFQSSTLAGKRGGDVGNDRLFPIFRAALRSIHAPEGDSTFRESLYNICHRYLTGMEEVSKPPEVPSRRLYSTRTVKAAGDNVIDLICDDAYGGSETCRVSALLLLNSFIAMAKEEKSSYMIDSIVRTNFILVLVETIKDIPQELRDSPERG